MGQWEGSEGAWEVGSNIAFNGNKERGEIWTQLSSVKLVQHSVLCCTSLLSVTHASL